MNPVGNTLGNEASSHVFAHHRKTNSHEMRDSLYSIVSSDLTPGQKLQLQETRGRSKELLALLSLEQVKKACFQLNEQMLSEALEKAPPRMVSVLLADAELDLIKSVKTKSLKGALSLMHPEERCRLLLRCRDAEKAAAISQQILPQRFKELCAALSLEKKVQLAPCIQSSDRMKIFVESLELPGDFAMMETWDEATLCRVGEYIPIQYFYQFIQTIPPSVFANIPLATRVAHKHSILSLVKALQEDKPQQRLNFKFAQMSDQGLRAVLVFGKDYHLNKMIDTIEFHRLVMLMEEMDKVCRKRVVGTVPREAMCMLVPLLSEKVLKDCASSLAKRMTMVQLSALCDEQFCSLVPKLQGSQVTEMTEALVEIQANKRKRRLIASVPPSAIGIAAYHEQFRAFILFEMKRLTLAQLKRSVPLMDPREFAAVFQDLSAEAKKVIQTALSHNVFLKGMKPQEVFAQMRAENPDPRTVRKFLAIKALLFPFFENIEGFSGELDEPKTAEEFYHASLMIEPESELLTDESDRKTFSDTSGSGPETVDVQSASSHKAGIDAE